MDIRAISNAAYEAFEYLVDMFGSDTVLNEMYDYLSMTMPLVSCMTL